MIYGYTAGGYFFPLKWNPGLENVMNTEGIHPKIRLQLVDSNDRTHDFRKSDIEPVTEENRDQYIEHFI